MKTPLIIGALLAGVLFSTAVAITPDEQASIQSAIAQAQSPEEKAALSGLLEQLQSPSQEPVISSDTENRADICALIEQQTPSWKIDCASLELWPTEVEGAVGADGEVVGFGGQALSFYIKITAERPAELPVLNQYNRSKYLLPRGTRISVQGLASRGGTPTQWENALHHGWKVEINSCEPISQ